jgi:hypothetical protein
MKYRIVNIEYWKQFTQRGEPLMYEKIRNFFNDEVHILDENTAQHGLLWNCITVAKDHEFSMEEMTEPKKEITEPKKEEFICDVCQKVCKSRIGLVGHKRTHSYA